MKSKEVTTVFGGESLAAGIVSSVMVFDFKEIPWKVQPSEKQMHQIYHMYQSSYLICKNKIECDLNCMHELPESTK